MIPEKFIYLAALLNLTSTATYIFAIVRGDTRPNRVTWFIWMLAPFIAVFAQLAEGVGLSTLIVFMGGVGPLIILISSFTNQNAYWQTTPFDWVCGALALIGLVGWWLTKDGDIAIFFSIATDFCAALPTVRKSYIHPQSENGVTYLLAFLSNVIGLLCVQQKTFAGYAFISYMTIMCGFIGLIIYSRKSILAGNIKT